jgi:protein-tyrosine phosphatase
MIASNRLLFLCTGNYYRSRYAEELFNHLARGKGLSWRAFSRGAAERGSPDNVGPISRYALDALVAKGIEAEGATRAPQPCAPSDFESATLVIALKEAEHRPLIERRFPQFADRVVYWHVDDIEFLQPSIALAMIDDQVKILLLSIGSPAR